MTDPLISLRQQLASLGRGAGPGDSGLFSLGMTAVDSHLGGGLTRGGLHEVFAENLADTAAATGFSLALATRAMGRKHLVWIRQGFLDTEAGEPYGPGLVEHGLDPDRLILVRPVRGQDALRVAGEAAHCRALGAVFLDLWDTPKALDLTASRRLALAASQSGVPVILTRTSADPVASAAASRWQVRSMASAALEANAPGLPFASSRRQPAQELVGGVEP